MSSSTDRVWELEEQILTSEVRSDAARLEQLLAPGFREIGISGRLWSRAEIIEALTGEHPDALGTPDISERSAEDLDGGHVLLTYRLQTRDHAGWRTSLWQTTAYGTTLLFHQATPIA